MGDNGLRIRFSQPLVALVTLAIAGFIALDTATCASAAETAAIVPAMSCDALGKSDLTALETRLSSTAKVSRNGHDFCDVKGYISPATQFEALLPESTWRGDYLQQGCGGLCGQTSVNLDDPSRTSGYQAPYGPLSDGEMVVAADDQGHETPNNGDALWAKNDLRLRAVFGYSSEHQLAQTMKALIRLFYARKPSYSYFSGVSDGGHEALVLAQRYPEDFDGILAGAPANNWAPLTLFELWLAASNRDSRGRQILTAEKLPALHAAVMAACANDHGVIEDPRTCTFDPATLRCADGADKPECLTNDQLRVVRDEYRGPKDSEGRGLFDGGEPYGSELAWAGWLVNPASDTAAPSDTYAAQIGLGFFNNMAFLHNPRGGYTLDSVPFSVAIHQQLALLGGIYNATDPDLSAFQAQGGKLIIYHSWADQAIPPFATIDYYRAVIRQMGEAATQAFSRIYLIPGLYHCPCGQPVDGDPATTVQLMPQLVDWVEHGHAPGALNLPVTAQSAGTRLDALRVEPFDVSNPVPRNEGLNSKYNYIGETSDYKPGNALWCPEDSQPLICAPRGATSASPR